MKRIIKRREPAGFTSWKDQRNDDWQPTYQDLSGATKKAVKKNLMEEQGCICCYCEQRLKDHDSHIEHIRPQSDTAVDPLNYENMVCSCLGQQKKGAPSHCGVLKGNWFDEQLFISPIAKNCESQFAYTFDGEIQPLPENNSAAKQTINKLGLSIPKLNALRKNALEPFLDASLNDGDLANFVAGYLERDGHDKFGEFWSTINFLFVPD